MKSKCTSYLREIVDLFSVYPLANTDAENSSTFLNYFIFSAEPRPTSPASSPSSSMVLSTISVPGCLLI